MSSETHPPPTTTIPSNPTIDTNISTNPSSSPQPPPKASLLRRLYALLLKHLINLARSTDRTLLRLSKLLSTPTGIDALLCTLGYTLELLRGLLSRVLANRLVNIATSIAEKADGVLLPGETLVAALPAPTSTKALAQTVGSFKALAGVISDFRIFVRLWGLVGIYTWARGTWNAPLGSPASRRDRVVRGVTWAQIAAGVAFQVLENGAYLASKGVLTSEGWVGDGGKKREMWWWVWSSRFWAAHVALEGVRLFALRGEERGEASAEEEKVERDGEKEGKLLKEKRKKENWTWWRDAVSNVAYAPMTLHWSVEEGLFGDEWIGAFGAVAGGALLLDKWRETA